MPSLEDGLAQVQAELASVAERLTDLALDQLREGLRGGEDAAQAAKEMEKRLSRARRAVEKAAFVLSSAHQAMEDDS